MKFVTLLVITAIIGLLIYSFTLLRGTIQVFIVASLLIMAFFGLMVYLGVSYYR